MIVSFIVTLILIAAHILITTQSLDMPSPYQQGVVMGATAALVIFLLLFSLIFSSFAMLIAYFARGSCKKAFLTTFFICLPVLSFFLVLSTATGSIKSSGKESEQSTIAGLSEDMNIVANAINASQNNQLTEEMSFATLPEAKTDFERMRIINQEAYKSMLAAQNEYHLNLKTTGYLTLLDANRVFNDKKSAASYAIIEQAEDVVKEARAKATQQFLNYPSLIAAVDFDSEREKKSMIFGAQTALNEKRVNFDRNWDIEEQLVGLTKEAITMLEESKARWFPYAGTFNFDNNSDLTNFQNIMKKIEEGSAEQVKLQQQGIKDAQKSLSEI